jgi:uncharacterized membrane protein
MRGTPFAVSGRRLAVLAGLALVTLLCAAMVVVRMRATGTNEATGLLWNLFLGWLPLVFALAVYDGHRRGWSVPALGASAGLWLLFFPNAPYLVTDLRHLGEWTAAPRMYDVLMLASAAFAGLALAFVSLYLLHAVARARFGAVSGWLAALSALGLGAFGIFLGLYGRWNSWDLFTRPERLLAEVARGLADPLAHTRQLGVVVLLAAFLTVGYVFFYAVRPTGLLESDEHR